MNTSMRAAQVRLLARANGTDRALEHAETRLAQGSVPPVRETDGAMWTSWIAAGPVAADPRSR